MTVSGHTIVNLFIGDDPGHTPGDIVKDKQDNFYRVQTLVVDHGPTDEKTYIIQYIKDIELVLEIGEVDDIAEPGP